MKKHTHPLKAHKHPRYDVRLNALEKIIKKLETRLHKIEHKLSTHSH
ncbi:MAG TPA: hypothetical protein VMS18_29820 [Candidatus Binatia bacterium]|nr:hypothetical protein [Candidatus Binatia bacterium]